MAASHSTGALSACVVNLPPDLREPDSDKLQRFIKPLVDDLLWLYNEGTIVRTPSCPTGRHVRVVILAVVCHHPAMVKLSGFADHSHRMLPCTQCLIGRVQIGTEGWRPHELRCGQLHKELADRYQNLESKHRPTFVKNFATRWSELDRLPYFNPVTMSVVDPMHSCLLGVTRTLWYSVWVKGGKKKFEMPRWFARLPSQIGEPTGASLTSDEWKALAILYGPTALPHVLLSAAREDSQRVPSKAADNFLKLGTVLKIWMHREVAEEDSTRSRNLYSEFFEEFAEIYGHENVTPTFHWLSHMTDQISRSAQSTRSGLFCSKD
ncbi:hypothetical protein DACRYDRAFT_14360 [Dacryopinax primogenitus]|uniref:Uncharacterized protein n=1 Tax=Dacryopinax primogenitus (strain DJM 731) TaxID=1858805 RepID=M5G7U3_DACPD|nr:uncharacterized protein DACRYDRAFT_14360 [Dacryopinax primogenitus]EJU04200.1 hypothetical protein DACRYDRAFT_14360 [Dacryopinax primogenitus]